MFLCETAVAYIFCTAFNPKLLSFPTPGWGKNLGKKVDLNASSTCWLHYHTFNMYLNITFSHWTELQNAFHTCSYIFTSLANSNVEKKLLVPVFCFSDLMQHISWTFTSNQRRLNSEGNLINSERNKCKLWSVWECWAGENEYYLPSEFNMCCSDNTERSSKSILQCPW